MTKREEIEGCISALMTIIENARKEILDLRRESYLLSDEKQWFEEKMECHGNRKKKQDYLIGRIHWIDQIEDCDTGTWFPVKRSAIVRVDGEWQRTF